MASVIKSAGMFSRALGIPFAAFTAAISDPFRWLEASGIMTPHPIWIVPEAWRQFGLLVFAFAWLFAWYHKQVVAFEAARPQTANMEFYRALRYLCRESVWASRFAGDDYKFDEALELEFCGKLGTGELQAWGRPKLSGLAFSPGTTLIEKEFWLRPNWLISNFILADQPARSVYQRQEDGGRGFADVRLDRFALEGIWPKRSLWSRIRRASPAERLGLPDRWAKQDTESPMNGW